ncbi:ferrous iron transport protein A [Gammaproteobacteria bacterium]
MLRKSKQGTPQNDSLKKNIYTTSMMKENVITLSALEKNHEAIIVAVTAGHKAAKRLADLGLTPNTTIKILRRTLFCGPMEIQARGSKLILGKGVTTKILVRKL